MNHAVVKGDRNPKLACCRRQERDMGSTRRLLKAGCGDGAGRQPRSKGPKDLPGGLFQVTTAIRRNQGAHRGLLADQVKSKQSGRGASA